MTPSKPAPQRLLTSGRVEEVGLDELGAGRDRGAVATAEVVEHGDLVTGAQQPAATTLPM